MLINIEEIKYKINVSKEDTGITISVSNIQNELKLPNKDIEELIDVSLSVIDMVGKYDLNQPIISSVISGGNHTSGMIQYAYNLYRLNSSQTKISPLTDLISLGKGDQGGGLNEIVGALPIIDIIDIDPDAGKKLFNKFELEIEYESSKEFLTIALFGDHTSNINTLMEYARENAIICRSNMDTEAFGTGIELSDSIKQGCVHL